MRKWHTWDNVIYSLQTRRICQITNLFLQKFLSLVLYYDNFLLTKKNQSDFVVKASCAAWMTSATKSCLSISMGMRPSRPATGPISQNQAHRGFGIEDNTSLMPGAGLPSTN